MSANETVAQTLAGCLATIVFEGLSETAKQVATASIIDTIGAMLLGASGPVNAALQAALADDLVDGPAFVFGRGSRAGVLDAALINATSAHANDYDDMACSMGGRPSAPLVPVVLALGEALGASGALVIEAYVVGFEAECRIGRVVNPHHYERGWHPTSTLGVFGAAAAAARLLRLDRDRSVTALTLAASMASGLKANFGTMAKPLQVGQCARNGLMAAKLANAGFTANPAALEHPLGFFASYDGLDNIHLERLLDHPSGRLEIEQHSIGLKPFPCCGSTHPVVRAMLALRARGLHPEDIDSVLMSVNRRRLPHTNNPSPRTALEARFSIQYVAARTLLDGPPRLHHFEGGAHLEPDVRSLMRKMSIVAYPAYAGDEGRDERNEFEADVTVLTRSGDQLEANAPHALGRGGVDPMTSDELWTKFSDCASRSLGSVQIGSAFAALQQLVNCTRISDLMDLMSPPPVVAAAAVRP